MLHQTNKHKSGQKTKKNVCAKKCVKDVLSGEISPRTQSTPLPPLPEKSVDSASTSSEQLPIESTLRSMMSSRNFRFDSWAVRLIRLELLELLRCWCGNWPRSNLITLGVRDSGGSLDAFRAVQPEGIMQSYRRQDMVFSLAKRLLRCRLFGPTGILISAIEDSRWFFLSMIRGDFCGFGSVKCFVLCLEDAGFGSPGFGSLNSGSAGCWFALMWPVVCCARRLPAFDGQTMVEFSGSNEIGTALNRLGVKHWLILSSFTRSITIPPFPLSAFSLCLLSTNSYFESFTEP